MKHSANPSPFPLVLWILATTLGLADVILRLTDGHVIPDILYFPVAVTVLFAGITVVYLRRFLRDQKAAHAAHTSGESSDGEQA